MRKVLFVHPVHLGEVTHGSEEDGRLDMISSHMHTYKSVLCDWWPYLDDPINGRASRLENGFDALARRLRLVCNAALDELAGGIGGDLAGHAARTSQSGEWCGCTSGRTKYAAPRSWPGTVEERSVAARHNVLW